MKNQYLANRVIDGEIVRSLAGMIHKKSNQGNIEIFLTIALSELLFNCGILISPAVGDDKKCSEKREEERIRLFHKYILKNLNCNFF